MANITIQFRTKFQKAFPDYLEKLREVFQEYYLPAIPAFMLGLLWKLTYDPLNIIYDIHYDHALRPLYNIFSSEPLDAKKVTLIRNEIRYQCTINDPNFYSELHLSSDDLAPYKLSFESLSKAADEITAYEVYVHCRDFIDFTTNDVARCLYLLNSAKQENVYGGLRTLGFSSTESNFLLPFGKESALLLESVLKEAPKPDTISPKMDTSEEDASESDSSRSDSSEVVETSNTQTPSQEILHENGEEIVVAQENEVMSKNSITPDQILQHKDLFKRTIAVMEELAAHGFDFSEVASKRKEIKNFLQCLDSFNSL